MRILNGGKALLGVLNGRQFGATPDVVVTHTESGEHFVVTFRDNAKPAGESAVTAWVPFAARTCR